MINFPMTVDPSTEGFDYTASNLGITPVVEQKTMLKMRAFSSYDPVLPEGVNPTSEVSTLMAEANMGGDFDTIWIGKDASMNFIWGNTYNTARHEIRSLAFEDGRTELFKDLKFGMISMYQEGGDGCGFFHTYEEGGSTYDDLTSPYYATSTEVPQADPDYPEEFPAWHDYSPYELSFLITKEVKLPEGITSFPMLRFAHTAFDSYYEWNDKYEPDNWDSSEEPWKDRLRDRHDIDIYVPSTVSSFNICTDKGSTSLPETNSFDFGMDIGYPSMFSLLDSSSDVLIKAGFTSIPTKPNRSSYDSDEKYERAVAKYESIAQEIVELSDHVHIYLKNHTAVPTINFVNSLYFPVVFHINEDIYDDFATAYGNSLTSFGSKLDGISPLSFVKIETYGGKKEEEVQTSLSETKFSSVAITGSYNDLKDKPESFAPNMITSTEIDSLFGRGSWELVSASVSPSSTGTGEYLFKKTVGSDISYILAEGPLDNLSAINVTVDDQNQVVTRGEAASEIITVTPNEVPQEYEIITVSDQWHDWRYETTFTIEDDIGDITLTGYSHITHIE